MAGATPLIACLGMLHSQRAYLKICEALLQAGAAQTLGVRDKTGRTALDWAKDGRPKELVPLLEKHGAEDVVRP